MNKSPSGKLGAVHRQVGVEVMADIHKGRVYQPWFSLAHAIGVVRGGLVQRQGKLAVHRRHPRQGDWHSRVQRLQKPRALRGEGIVASGEARLRGDILDQVRQLHRAGIGIGPTQAGGIIMWFSENSVESTLL